MEGGEKNTKSAKQISFWSWGAKREGKGRKGDLNTGEGLKMEEELTRKASRNLIAKVKSGKDERKNI